MIAAAHLVGAGNGVLRRAVVKKIMGINKKIVVVVSRAGVWIQV